MYRHMCPNSPMTDLSYICIEIQIYLTRRALGLSQQRKIETHCFAESKTKGEVKALFTLCAVYSVHFNIRNLNSPAYNAYQEDPMAILGTPDFSEQ